MNFKYQIEFKLISEPLELSWQCFLDTLQKSIQNVAYRNVIPEHLSRPLRNFNTGHLYIKLKNYKF